MIALNKYLCTPWSYLHCQFSRHHFTPRHCNIGMSWTFNWLFHFVLFEPCRALPHENLINHSQLSIKRKSFPIFLYPYPTTSPANLVALISPTELTADQLTLQPASQVKVQITQNDHLKGNSKLVIYFFFF